MSEVARGCELSELMVISQGAKVRIQAMRSVPIRLAAAWLFATGFVLSTAGAAVTTFQGGDRAADEATGPSISFLGKVQ